MCIVHNEFGSAIQVKITQFLKNLMTDFKKVNEHTEYVLRSFSRMFTKPFLHMFGP